MKILWVKAGKLLPLDTGGKIRSFNILRRLASRHEITALTYYGGLRDEAYERTIAQQLPGATTIHTGAPDGSTMDRAGDYLYRLFWSAPYAVSKFTDRRVQQVLAEWIGERRFDIAVCDFLGASLNFPRILSIPTVLFQHNIETALWRRLSFWEENPLKKLLYKLEAAKMKQYEKAAVNRFHHIIAVSDHDRKQLEGMTASARITVVPTGVDLDVYQAAAGPSASEPLVIFTGSMDWEPNIDGVIYFCREIWPRVRERVQTARFRIVGRNPPSQVRRLESDSVEVTGTVPSVTDHLREAAVVVVPLRIGGGTRLKIYEAMAVGKAVVSTSIGAEGLDVRDGQDILLADDAATFAAAVARLLVETDFRKQLEKVAARLAAQHDWSVISERFVDVLKQVAQQGRAADMLSSTAASVNI